MKSRRVAWPVIVLAVGVGLGLLVGQIRPGSTPDPTLVVAKIRDIGELRTARASSTHIERIDTSLDAPAGLAWLPGADVVSRFATQNEAVLSVNSTVDAGVDLSQAKVERSGDELIVTLPKARILGSDADAKMETHRSGLLWRDDEIGLKGQEQGENRATEAAKLSGLVRKAEANAESLVRNLIQEAGGKTVKIRFVVSP